jgi:hypothetical protein
MSAEHTFSENTDYHIGGFDFTVLATPVTLKVAFLSFLNRKPLSLQVMLFFRYHW